MPRGVCALSGRAQVLPDVPRSTSQSGAAREKYLMPQIFLAWKKRRKERGELDEGISPPANF
jgi:hypothetical protein